MLHHPVPYRDSHAPGHSCDWRCIATGDVGCPRYRILGECLAAANGRLDKKAAMQLLADVAQEGTQWSVVYNMSSGEVSLTVGQDYHKIHSLQLASR